MKQDIKQKVIEAIGKYKSDKTCWVPLAKLLFEFQGKEDFSNVEGLSKIGINRLVSSYGFLNIHRPDALKSPYDQINNSARAISFLPVIYGQLSKETRDKDIQEYIERILSGKLSGNHVEVVAMRLKGEKQGIALGSSWTRLLDRKISTGTLEENELILVGKIMGCFEDQIQVFIKRFDYDTLRKHFSILCKEIVVDLNCISDAEYRKQWEGKNRSESSRIGLSEDELIYVEKILRNFRYQIRFFIKKFGYSKLNKLYSDLCNDIFIKLNCIGDENYKRAWDARKETLV